MVRVGIDIGGTFTDFVIYNPREGSISTYKLPSTPDNPANAVLEGLRSVAERTHATIIHGSTVATNALLERKGVRTVLVATKGFKDIIQIGRQNRPSLYDWNANPPEPLVSNDLRFEIDERVEHTGVVSKTINSGEVEHLVKRIQANNPDSIAICLLFSYLHPQHEELIAEQLRNAGLFVSCSSEVLPEFREYERCSTTVVNAYVSPILARYLESIRLALPTNKLEVMQSNGGMIGIEEAEKYGSRCILSGPAGGIVGASYIAKSRLLSDKPTKQIIKIITFDMGGTSTDVSLIDENPSLTKESIVGGVPVALPMLDIHTIGAGGGSIAKIDPGGVLCVGPESAGAQPGPACYGTGELATVTDANLLLGRILPDHFLGGKIRLDKERSRQSLRCLGKQIGLDEYRTALGVIEVVNTHMERALRVTSVEKGYDPKEFSLLTFGGAGGLHATDLAQRLGIPLVIIPPLASTLSAFGMLATDYIKDYTKTIMTSDYSDKGAIISSLKNLRIQAEGDLRDAGFRDEQTQIESSVDMRYVGQSYELNIPFNSDFEQNFSEVHNKIYGYQRAEEKTEIVNLRVRAIGKVEKPLISKQTKAGVDPSPAFYGTLPVVLAEGEKKIPFYQGELLHPGNIIPGPAIIIRPDTTILLNKSDYAEVDQTLNLIIRIE